VKRIEIDDLSLHFEHGLVTTVWAVLQGQLVATLTVRGARVQLDATSRRAAPRKKPSPHLASSPAPDHGAASGGAPSGQPTTSSAAAHAQPATPAATVDPSAKAAKLGRKLSKVLHYLGCITVDVRDVQVVVAPYGLVALLPHISWAPTTGPETASTGGASDSADGSGSGTPAAAHRLACRKPSVCIRGRGDDNNSAGLCVCVWARARALTLVRLHLHGSVNLIVHSCTFNDWVTCTVGDDACRWHCIG
jgi:hypothetical protein